MKENTSAERQVEHQTPELVLKQTIQEAAMLHDEARQVLYGEDDADKYKEKIAQRAQLIASLSERMEKCIEMGLPFPKEELRNIQSVSNIANDSLRGDHIVPGLGILYRLGSRDGDPNFLEEIYNRVYSANLPQTA